MAAPPARTGFIVSQEGLVSFKLNQLSPAISNAKVDVRVMRILPNHNSERGSTTRSTLLVVRDDDMTAVVCCWDFTSVVRANSLRFGDYIEIQYPDIRYRKNGVPLFPTTCEYELHVGSTSKTTSTNYSVKSSLIQISGSDGLYSAPLISSFSSLKEVCNADCVNSVVTIGAVITHIGEVKHSNGPNGSIYRTHRLWDPSLSDKEYINITLWDTNGECFESVQIGDGVIAERVKVVAFRSTFQLSSASYSLYHFNVNLPQVEDLRNAWMMQAQPKKDPLSLPQLHRKVGLGRITTPSHAIEPLSGRKPQKKRKSSKKDSLITDFFQHEAPAHETSLVSSSYVAESSTVPSKLHIVQPEEKCFSFVSEATPPLHVLGRFSVADALNLKENQSCWTVACLVDLMARTPRGWCVYNCMACGKAISDCNCASSTHSPVWTFDVCTEWRDVENTISTPLDNCLASLLLQAPAAIFVGWNESERQLCVSKVLGKTFKLLFEKPFRGKLKLKEMVELPLFEED